MDTEDNEEEKKEPETNQTNNPYIDNTLINDLKDYTKTANEQFISNHKIITCNLPKKLLPAPETIEFSTYNSDKKDYEIEQFLYTKYKAQIKQSFECFDDDIIFRFVTGYRHINDYNKRMEETERLFSEYLAWHSASNLDTILSITQINNVSINEYVRGCYLYGMDKYGHPVFYDEGLKYRKKCESMKLFKDCGEKGMDMVLAYLMKKLRDYKVAINACYGQRTFMDYDNESNEKRQIGIVRQTLVFDLTKFSSIRALKDIKLHEYILRRFSTLFPEMIHRVFIINAPWAFQKVWKIAKGFLHPNTAKKTKILGTNYQKVLYEEIDRSMIPIKYGGLGQWNQEQFLKENFKK